MMSRNAMLGVLVLGLLVIGALWFLGTREAADTQDGEEAAATNSDMLIDGGMEVRAESVEYYDGVTGHYAAPVEEGEYPGVVMIHEWWGLNDNIRDMAEELAAEGYRVLAVDLFNGSVASTAEAARAQTQALDQEEALANMQAAIAYLRDQGATSLASLGWCFGGGQSLQLSLARGMSTDATPPLSLDATVIYYGQLETDPAELAAIAWPVLGIFGAEDQSIPVDDVNAFDAALTANETPHEVHIYPGVGHAFANPSGDNYAPEETRDAWAKTLAFLNENLK